jgi:uncharacterized protein YggE
MKKYLFVIVFITTLTYGQEGLKNFIDQNYIELTGKAELEIVPDEIYLSITINEKDKRDLTVEKLEKLMIQKLKALGVDIDKKLSVLNFSGDYAKYFLHKNKVEKNKQYELLIHKTELLPRVFKLLDDINISNVTISRTDHSEIEEYKRTAKINALKVAKEKSTDYAKAIHQTIGKALYIKEVNSHQYGSNQMLSNTLNEVVMMRGTSSSFDKKKFQNIQLAKINISATVLARFELK